MGNTRHRKSFNPFISLVLVYARGSQLLENLTSGVNKSTGILSVNAII